jgi:perosamine synthetase
LVPFTFLFHSLGFWWQMRFHSPVWPPQWPEILDSVANVVQSGDWGRYHSVACKELRERLLHSFRDSCFPDGHQTDDVRLCCSGNAALELALRAAKIGSGDEVLISAYDYPGNLRTIELLGAKPVLMDVKGGGFGFDEPSLVDACSRAETQSIRAVIVSHLFGEVLDAEPIRKFCDQKGWVLIEDVCQSLGAKGGNPATSTMSECFEHSFPEQLSPTQSAAAPIGLEANPIETLDKDASSSRPRVAEFKREIQSTRFAGCWGHLATLSFGGSKPVSAGAGGALVVNDTRLAASIGSWLERPGEVYPISPLQAAVLGPQLDRLQELQAQRNRTWQSFYRDRQDAYPRWQWMVAQQRAVEPNPYKIAWLAESREQRDRVIQAAHKIGLPIGEGYRSFAKMSDRRCRKLGACDRAKKLGDQLFVLDHRALLLEPSRIEQLVSAMDALYRQVDT